ncbi:MAG: hypothetical protein QM754_17120 [Tepidisphaeraceae bacterium]
MPINGESAFIARAAIGIIGVGVWHCRQVPFAYSGRVYRYALVLQAVAEWLITVTLIDTQ